MALLKNKIILITGGGQGLGKAICENLADADATVICSDIVLEKAETVAEGINRKGKKAFAMLLDVSDPGSIHTAMQIIKKRCGRIDVLVNNAAIDLTKPLMEITGTQFEQIIDINLLGPVFMTKAVLSEMIERRSGHIVNIASTASKRTWPNASAYHASKWGLLGFSHALHAEVRGSGVKVTAVVSGGMRTPFILDRFPDTDPNVLQDPSTVAATVRFVLTVPEESVIPEVMIIPMKETSWP